jgi:formylglycine-generating enzyme required for sulfatase activity
MVHAANLDPARDLRYGNWRGFDLSGADLRGFNFMGADLTGARFDKASITGAIFDRATYDLPSLRKAADFDEFLKQELRRPARSRPQLSDHRLKDFEVIRDTPLCPQLVVIPAGEFLMGSAEHETLLKNDDRAFDDEIMPGQGRRRMRIARRYALGRYPVTFEEYDRFLTPTARERQPFPLDYEADDMGMGRGQRPVINISCQAAQAYCAWLNRIAGPQSGFDYRLPSESEWEYACRAGTNTRRWWGDDWDPAKANGNRDFEGGKLSPVGHYLANPWGLHDMIGNVSEWCADRYTDISELPSDGQPYGATLSLSLRVLRGGNWNSEPRKLRSASRDKDMHIGRNMYPFAGFRVARTLWPPSS